MSYIHKLRYAYIYTMIYASEGYINMSDELSILLIDLYNVDYGARSSCVWNGLRSELVDREVVKLLVDKLTDGDWRDEDEMWDYDTLFGVSANQTKEAFCKEVEEKYKGKEYQFIVAINTSDTCFEKKLLVGYHEVDSDYE